MPSRHSRGSWPTHWPTFGSIGSAVWPAMLLSFRSRLTDFKNSRSRWNADHVEGTADQLLLYAQLVRDIAQGRRLKLQFCVITKTKDPSVECHAVEWSPARAARSTRIVERVWPAIASSHFYPAPSAQNCGSCPFREACRVWGG